MPRLVEKLLPALLDVVENGQDRQLFNVLPILRELGPDVKPSLPRLKACIPQTPTRTLHNVPPIFLAAGKKAWRFLPISYSIPRRAAKRKSGCCPGIAGNVRRPPYRLTPLPCSRISTNSAIYGSVLPVILIRDGRFGVGVRNGLNRTGPNFFQGLKNEAPVEAAAFFFGEAKSQAG